MSGEDMSLFELLIEMKDTSELMVSLAYSALLYHNKEIAEEVLLLEEEMDAMFGELKRKAIAEAKGGSGVEKILVYLQMSESMEAIGDAALSIADVVLRDVELHPIFQMSIMDSDTVINGGRVAQDSSLAGARLGDVNLASETGMWIIAVRRGKKWKFGPDEYTILLDDDVVIAEGPAESIPRFKAVLSGEEKL